MTETPFNSPATDRPAYWLHENTRFVVEHIRLRYAAERLLRRNDDPGTADQARRPE